MKLSEQNQTNRLTVLASVLLIADFLAKGFEIARFENKLGEKIVIGAAALIAFANILYHYARIRDWCRQCIRDLWLARLVRKAKLSKDDANKIGTYVVDLTKGQKATAKEVASVVVDAPVTEYLTETNRPKAVEQIREEITKAKIVSRRPNRAGMNRFRFECDLFQFSTSQKDLPVTMTHLKTDIMSRFGGLQFDTLIHIVRDKEKFCPSFLVDELQKCMHIKSIIEFPAGLRKREKNAAVWDAVGRCDGKSVLLLEPILIDDGLDNACAMIRKAKAVIGGILVLFEVRDALRGELACRADIIKAFGSDALRGQIILDLQKTD